MTSNDADRLSIATMQRERAKRPGGYVHPTNLSGSIVAEPESSVRPEGQNIWAAFWRWDQVFDDLGHAGFPVRGRDIPL